MLNDTPRVTITLKILVTLRGCSGSSCLLIKSSLKSGLTNFPFRNEEFPAGLASHVQLKVACLILTVRIRCIILYNNNNI